MTSNQQPYENKCNLPFILYPPQMYEVADGDDFAHSHLGLDKSAGDYVIYLGIPFCRVQCYACPYFVSLLKEGEDTNDIEQRYVAALIKDMKQWAAYPRFRDGKLRSVYIGGGTGSILKTKHLKQVIDTVRTCFPLAQDYDLTLEGNARDFDAEKIDFVAHSAINRVSLGVQSFDPEYLLTVGSPHEAELSIHVIQGLQRGGLHNINADIMYNVPGHTMRVLGSDLRKLGELGVNHVTAYAYRIHRDTKQERRISLNQVKDIHPIDSQEVQSMHAEVCDKLAELGLQQYMFDHFARPGFQSKYQYWTFREGVDALGIGAGAYSFVNNYRVGTSKKVEKYIATVESDRHYIVSASKHIEPQHRRERYVIFAMQYFFLDYAEYFSKFGSAFTEDFAAVLERLQAKGLVEVGDQRTVMTALGQQWKMNTLLEFINDSFWGDREAVKQPNWAMNISMVDLTAAQREFWLGERNPSPSQAMEPRSAPCAFPRAAATQA